MFDEIGCDRCHNGPMFSDFDLEAEGVPEHPLLAEPDRGDGRFRFRLDPEPVVHSAPELLPAPEVPLRRLDGDVPQEKLNLIQLATGQMAQAGAGPSEVVRRQSFDESPRVTVS